MEESAAQLSFFIPTALAERAREADSPCACLETLIARGTTTRSAATHEALLLELFGGDSSAGSARAAIGNYARNGADLQQWRIIATPIHLLADHATLHFPQQPPSLLTAEESLALMASCQDYFAEEGWLLDYGDADEWYLQLTHATEITTSSPAQATGRPLFEQLPQGSDAKIWRRWSNEVQMLLHGHPVNEARRSRGQPLVNSLWFWGEGRLPTLQQKLFVQVFGGDRFVQGLAQLSGTHWSPLPQGLAQLQEATLKGPALIVLGEEGAGGWDEQWFCPLQKSMKRHEIKRASLHFNSGHATQLTSATVWRLWRRRHLTVAAPGTAA